MNIVQLKTLNDNDFVKKNMWLLWEKERLYRAPVYYHVTKSHTGKEKVDIIKKINISLKCTALSILRLSWVTGG